MPKSQIAQKDLWTWPHEMPTAEEMQRIMDEAKKEQDEWNEAALSYLKKQGLLKETNGTNVS